MPAPFPRRAGRWLLGVGGTFFVLRAVVELFVVDWSQPTGYRDDWGGPSLAGVLAVHCGPGLPVLLLAGRRLARRRRGSEIVN